MGGRSSRLWTRFSSLLYCFASKPPPTAVLSRGKSDQLPSMDLFSGAPRRCRCCRSAGQPSNHHVLLLPCMVVFALTWESGFFFLELSWNCLGTL